MKNHKTKIGAAALILMTLLLGMAPRILKANQAQETLAGRMGCSQAPVCTPSPSPTPYH